MWWKPPTTKDFLQAATSSWERMAVANPPFWQPFSMSSPTSTILSTSSRRDRCWIILRNRHLKLSSGKRERRTTWLGRRSKWTWTRSGSKSLLITRSNASRTRPTRSRSRSHTTATLTRRTITSMANLWARKICSTFLKAQTFLYRVNLSFRLWPKEKSRSL